MNKRKRSSLVEIFVHILVWAILTYFFIHNSAIRPMAPRWKELLCLAIIAAACYLNYFFLYPFFFKKRKKILYFILLLFSVLAVTWIEIGIVLPDVKRCIGNMRDPEVARQITKHISILLYFRNVAIIAFSVLYTLYKDAEKAYWLEKDKRRIELEFLQSKIDNHFLFNTINLLYKDSLVQSERLPGLILRLSELLHFYVAESQNEKVPLKDELRYIQNYIDFELLRNQHPVAVSLNYINPEEREIELVPMLFESLINNAFKYVKKDGSGYIDIVFDLTEEGKLFFSCKNNKLIEENEKLISSTKKGLKNTQERLDLLYKKRHTFYIEQTDEYFYVTVTLSLSE